MGSLRDAVMSSTHYTACIDACNDCANACDHCTTACLLEADPKPLARCVALAIDCAAVCRLAPTAAGT